MAFCLFVPVQIWQRPWERACQIVIVKAVDRLQLEVVIKYQNFLESFFVLLITKVAWFPFNALKLPGEHDSFSFHIHVMDLHHIHRIGLLILWSDYLLHSNGLIIACNKTLMNFNSHGPLYSQSFRQGPKRQVTVHHNEFLRPPKPSLFTFLDCFCENS